MSYEDSTNGSPGAMKDLPVVMKDLLGLRKETIVCETIAREGLKEARRMIMIKSH